MGNEESLAAAGGPQAQGGPGSYNQPSVSSFRSTPLTSGAPVSNMASHFGQQRPNLITTLDNVNQTLRSGALNVQSQLTQGLHHLPHLPSGPPSRPNGDLQGSGGIADRSGSGLGRKSSLGAIPAAPAPAVDARGLSEEEMRQIAAVMERAAREMDGPNQTRPVVVPARKPSFDISSVAPPKSVGFGTSNLFPPPKSQPVPLPVPSRISVGRAPPVASPEVLEKKSTAPALHSHGYTGLAHSPVALPTKHVPPLTKSPAFSQEPTGPAQALIDGRVGSWSLSSESSLSSQESVDHSRLSSENKPSGVVSPEAHKRVGAGAQVETCPICQDTELKIVMVHGKPQPLIGQLCARCSLIVCSKCGKVKKGSDNKKAFWLCTNCADSDWEPHEHPAAEQDTVTTMEVQQAVTYVAPLTHLVTADNQVCSDVLRGSSASFLDEPQYVLSQSMYGEIPPDQQSSWFTAATALPGVGGALTAFQEEEELDQSYLSQQEDRGEYRYAIPADAAGIPQQHYGGSQQPTVDAYGYEVYQNQQSQFSTFQRTRAVVEEFTTPVQRSEHDQFASANQNQYVVDQVASEAYSYTDDRYWEEEEMRGTGQEWQEETSQTREDLFEEPMAFSSQESLSNIQEEETSDYGSQIHAACSDIASLSSSTSGGDTGLGLGFGIPKAWNLHNQWGGAGSGSSLEPHVQNMRQHPKLAPPASDTSSESNGNLRRSHLVENFRSMPTAASQVPSGSSSRAVGQVSDIVQPTLYSGENPSLQTAHVATSIPSSVPAARPGNQQQPQVLGRGRTQSNQAPQWISTESTSSQSQSQNQKRTPLSTVNKQENMVPAGNQSHVHFAQAPVQAVDYSASLGLQEEINSGANSGSFAGSVPSHNQQLQCLRRFLAHQASREDLHAGSSWSEMDDSDSHSVCTEALSVISAATFPLSSSMTGLARESRSGLGHTNKRRLPLLPKDEQEYGLSPEERERQKRELKRRISGDIHLYRNVVSSAASEPSLSYNSKRVSASTALVEEWTNNLPVMPPPLPRNSSQTKAVKRKKHKHLPQTPQDAPKLLLLKQQLRALAARKASYGYGDESLGSLPNNPVLNRFKSSSGQDMLSYSSAGDYGISNNSKTRSAAYQPSHTASDPALFRSVLEQYRQVEREEEKERERRMEFDRWNDTRLDGLDYGRPPMRPPVDYHPDPDIQEIVCKLQQINRDIAETKELFRSTSSLGLLGRGRRSLAGDFMSGPRWRSETDLSRAMPYPDARRVEPFARNVERQWEPSRSFTQFDRDGMLPFDQEPGRYGFGQKRLDVFDKRDDDRFPPLRVDGRSVRAGSVPPDFWNDRDPRFLPQQPPVHAWEARFHSLPHNHYRTGGGMRSDFVDRPVEMGQWNIHPEMDHPFGPSFPYGMHDPSYGPATGNEDLLPFEPFDNPSYLPMGPGMDDAATNNMPMEGEREYARFAPPPRVAASGPEMQMLDAPLPDSRVSCSDEGGVMRPLDGVAVWEEDKENLSDTGSDAMEPNEKLSKSMSLKKPKKDNTPKYNFGTKRILLTRDPKDRCLSGNGLGVRIAGGKLIPNTNILAAFISKIYDYGVMATLGEVKEGDQVLEWNGVPLTNKSYEEVQEVLDQSNGEVEMLLRCDYNVRDLELELEEQRIARRASHQAERVRIREYDSGDRSPGGRNLFGGPARKADNKPDDNDEVYRPANQLAPPSPGIMQRKKSTTSSGHAPVTGDVYLRMTYERCTLTLQVQKARNLKPADKSGYSDPYCKISLTPGRANEYKYKTKHVMQTLNPEWKETFTFQSIDPNEIHHKQIEITVWDWDRLSADDFLGEVNIDLADPVHLDGKSRWYPLGERQQGGSVEDG